MFWPIKNKLLNIFIARRLKRIPSKLFNFSNSFLSTNRFDNNKSYSTEQQIQLSPPPLPGNPPPQLLNQQFNFRKDDILGVVIQRQWRTTKNSSSIDSDNKSKNIMSAKVETTVRQWSTPVEKVVEGQPPRPVSHQYGLVFLL
ncbi:hypothetical protein LOAG_08964 [Loa loa]|uniref:Uncharacterized protein n=1 Tax=Loa loa TaxID=7209 RepID=A0A1S0TU81_LOALO|nr:hypothetical protein LOAG_08964 [Loa loa]EFO19528.1 hypothetical protein LOAG_08964 [Loa loa]